MLFKLQGTKSNRLAIGARVTVKTGKVTQISEVKGGSSYISQNDLRQHFGLGASATIDEVQVRWPNGNVETLRNVPADFIYTIVEGQGIKDKVVCFEELLTAKVAKNIRKVREELGHLLASASMLASRTFQDP